jgi:arylsulfatase A
MHRRRFLQASGISAAALTIGQTALGHCGTCETKPAAQKPSVILILVDDMGFGDPQCYNAKSLIPTPNIDALAKAGMRFTDAHSPSSVCTPTRYSILTGRYCWRTRLKRSVLWEWASPLIAKDRLTMGKMFQSLGYSTACVGKWHLGEDWSKIRTPLKKGAKPPKGKTAYSGRGGPATYDFTQPILEGPNTRGFDYYFGTSVPNFPPYCFIENDHTVGIPTEQKPKGMFGCNGPALKGWDLTKIIPGLFDKANGWVKTEAAKADKPFFLYLPLTGPHTPIAPTKKFQGKTKAGLYGDFIHEIDYYIGTLMKTLQDSGEADNTIVIFTSDNGSPARSGENMKGEKSSIHKTGHIPAGEWRGLKADAWEGGHRVPFIVRWPGNTPAAKISNEPVCSVDLIATLAAATGYDLPDDTAQDSHNLLDLFTGKPVGIDAGKPAIREAVVHHSIKGTFCLRQGDWKLIAGLGSGGFSGKGPKSLRPKGAKGQLYNLKLDPKENDNLWLKRPEKVAEFTALLKKYKKTGRSAPLRKKS